MTKTDLTRPDPLELVNISVRLFRVQRELIDRAVAKRGDVEYSLSDYIRETLTLQAAIDCGVEPPHVPSVTRGRGGFVAQAAAKLGMSVQDFEAAAIRTAASQALGSNALENRPSERPARQPASGTQSAYRPGAYSERPARKAR